MVGWSVYNGWGHHRCSCCSFKDSENCIKSGAAERKDLKLNPQIIGVSLTLCSNRTKNIRGAEKNYKNYCGAHIFSSCLVSGKPKQQYD